MSSSATTRSWWKTAWPLQNPVLYTLIWSVIVLLVFIPLTNLQYKRATAR